MDQEDYIVLGFDFGIKNIGVAVGNTMTQTAQPLIVLTAKEGQPDWNTVQRLLDEWQPSALIVGIPHTADGTVTDHIKRVYKFCQRLHGRFGLPVHQVDERYSSRESIQYVRPSKKHKKGELDAISAAIIIERWFASEP